MKKTLFLVGLLIAARLAAQPAKVFLSPKGDDHGKGTSASPFYSLNRAVADYIGDSSTDTLFIEIAPGEYYMDRPLRIDTPTNRPIVIRATGEEKPRFYGGIPITGWQKCGNNLYKAYIPEVKRFGFTFEQFYVNGQRATMARTPNVDWNYVKDSKEHAFVPGLRAADYAVQQIFFEPEELSSLAELSADEISDIRFRFYHKWDNTEKKIENLNVDSGYIYTQGDGMKPWNPITKGSRYIIYNYKGALDTPGEWFLDKKEGYVYYIPREGEDMNTTHCIAPGLHQWVILKGEKDHPVAHITFENLSFQYTSFIMPQNGNEPMQAAARIEAGMQFDFAEDIQLVDCELMHTGGYGLWLGQECHRNRIERCYIADLGAGGIKIGEPYFRQGNRPVTSHNVVHNSIITHAGSVFPCGVGIAMFHTADNEITHNEISDLRYSGVSVGWVWGYNNSAEIWTTVMSDKGTLEFEQMLLQSPAVRNLVAYNHIHHIGWGELSDMGAVYTLGESPGTRIVNNVIHDVLSYDYGGWGLYTDEGSTGIEMRNNLVYRCKSGGFHQHYGKENRIENNIFAFGHYYQAQYTRVEPHTSFSFKHNILLQDKGETLAGPWEKGNMEIDYNLYWHLDGSPTFKEHSFAEWKKLKEPHSVCMDPLFRNIQADDYTFTSLKAAHKIKFKPFDYSKAGVYGTDSWKEKAQLTPELLEAFNKAAAIRLKK